MRSQDDAMKAAVKEAIKEFLYERWTEFAGSFTKWALRLIGAAILSALLYLILWANGWRQP
jgi:hypothetical protein